VSDTAAILLGLGTLLLMSGMVYLAYRFGRSSSMEDQHQAQAEHAAKVAVEVAGVQAEHKDLRKKPWNEQVEKVLGDYDR
jgi:hypothetical protein